MLESYLIKDSDLYSRLNRFILEFTGQTKNEIVLTMSLKNDLGVDSLTLTEMIISLEDDFNICLGEEDLDPEKIQTVGDIVALVFKYVGNSK